MSKAAILNKQNDVIFEADIPEGVREIEIAGDITIDGAPVNRATYRVSRSKRNLDKARYAELLSEHSHLGLTFYTA